MLKVDLKDYKIVKFYGYASVIPVSERLDTVRLGDRGPKFDRYRDMYFEAVEMAKESYDEETYPNWEDNKCVFEFECVKDKSLPNLFIGAYDLDYTLGTGVKQDSGMSYDFKTKKWNYES
jgi:hypothetical protein